MKRLPLLIILFLFISVGCIQKQELGTESNPIKISLVPGQDVAILAQNGRALEKWIQSQTGYHVRLTVPINFIAVVEALGSKKADLAFMNTFGYLVGRERYGVTVALIGVNQGTTEYRGQILALKKGPQSLKDLTGKSFAFVDPVSTSGYILPAKLLKDQNVKLKDFIFAGRHDTVVQMVYQGRVAAGATYTSAPKDGLPQDARRLLLMQYPDIFEKVKVLATTDPIPNDPIVFRKDFPSEMKVKVIKAIKDYFQTEEGRRVMYDLYHMTGVQDVTDAHWDGVRKTLLDLGKSAQDFVK